MLYYFDVDLFNEAFHRNLEDWCLGGPRQFGHTRDGPMIFLEHEIHLVSCQHQMIDIEDVLSKNRDEINRWHLSFLQGGKIDTQSSYYIEYLLPRYGHKRAIGRMSDVLGLLFSIENGFDYHRPVWIADLAGWGLGFRYFRFDGAHRACCAKVCGMKEVPAWVFTAKAGS